MDAPPPAPGFDRFRAVPVMATFGVAEQRHLWTSSITRRYRPGEIIRVQGAPADHLLALLAGHVAAAHLTSAGRTVALDEFVAPCALDKVAVIDGEGHTATLTATEWCVVTAVPGRLFLTMIDRLPRARSHVFRALAAHARAQQARLLPAAMPNGGDRVAWWLTRQAPGPLAGPWPGLVRLPGCPAARAGWPMCWG